jgi:Fe-S-cluster containining protein
MTPKENIIPVEETEEGFRPLAQGRFKFSCQPGIPCFTACCADLHLILTPYDILRMKKRLRLPAGEFIKEYTRPHETGNLFPMISLKMREDERRRCPLVSPQGCTIYEDRPGACRLYPLGRGAAGGDPGGVEKEFYFLINELHCLGFREGREWTAEEWIQDQGVRLYNQMNRPWMEIVTSKNPRLREVTEQKLGMFQMVSYNLDRFRDFVFQTKFLEAFAIPAQEVESIAADEVALMNLGMKWLKFVFFGEDTLALRREG